MEKQTTPITISEIIGYILLTPPVISVLMFFAGLIGEKHKTVLSNLHSIWYGDWNAMESGGGGYTSALPLYFGLLALAGAYLIKNSKK